jgi:hypothetical protein
MLSFHPARLHCGHDNWSRKARNPLIVLMRRTAYPLPDMQELTMPAGVSVEN